MKMVIILKKGVKMGKQKKLSSMNGLSTTEKANIGRVLDLEKNINQSCGKYLLHQIL